MPRNAKRGETRERVFQFVRNRLDAGEPPTVREVQEALGFGAFQTAHAHLERLVEEGRLIKRQGAARGYGLPEELERRIPTIKVPILGQIQAGGLREAIEEREGEIAARAGDFEELFALRVRGESMRDAGILEGDLVIARAQPTAHSGEVVIALVDDEATVKTLWLHADGRVELRPENPDFSSIYPDPQACQILGKVVEVRRFLERGREG